MFDDNKKNTKIGIIEGQPEGIEKGMEKLEAIDNEIGNQLILKYFKENENDQCTFYQLNSFINVLGEQLKFLCGNHNLNAEQLQKAAYHFKIPSLKFIRSFIIKSLISLTKYCTKSAYESLLTGQYETSKYQIGKYDEEEAAKNALKYLTDKKIISFNELLEKTSIVFLNEDILSMTIITTRDKNSEEYKHLQDLYNSGKI